MAQPFSHDAVGRIYEDAAACGSLSLGPIADALGGSYGLFFSAKTVGGSIDEAYCHGVDHGYVHRLRQASVENMLPPWLGGLSPGSVFDRAAFGSDQAFGRTAFFNHVIRPEGNFHCMIATPVVSQSSRFHLIIGRPRHKVEFDANDRRVLQALLPHVGEVIRLRAEITATRALARSVERAVDKLPTQMIVVAADAAVSFANREAHRHLARADGLHLDSRGRVTASTRHDTVTLRQSIAMAVDGSSLRPVTLHVTCRSGGPPIQITVTPIERSDAVDPDCGEAFAMITIDIQRQADERDYGTALARAHGLTRRETDLATVLAQGRSLRDASRDLGMSYNTARSYLRQTFSKLDIHRQSDLIRLFATGLRPDGMGGRED